MTKWQECLEQKPENEKEGGVPRESVIPHVTYWLCTQPILVHFEYFQRKRYALKR